MENQIASSFVAVFENNMWLVRVPADFRDGARYTIQISNGYDFTREVL